MYDGYFLFWLSIYCLYTSYYNNRLCESLDNNTVCGGDNPASCLHFPMPMQSYFRHKISKCYIDGCVQCYPKCLYNV